MSSRNFPPSTIINVCLINEIQQDYYPNSTLIHPWEWLLPTPKVPEGLSSDYDLSTIPSCSQEAFAPSENAHGLVDNSLVNWPQWESSRSLATDTIEGPISVVFDTTAPLCNDDLSSEVICRTPYQGPGSCASQSGVLSGDMKDPREKIGRAHV